MEVEKPSEASNTEQLPVEASYQRSLIPLEIITSYNNDTNSVDMKSIVEARDGNYYAVKTTQEGQGKIPASELLCYELAYRVLIPTPPYAFIKLPTGELAFGSRWEGGAISDAIKSKIEYMSFIRAVISGEIRVTNLKTILSKIYALDLFVNNLDRHWGNYLWRSSYGGSLVVMAFDFGRACFESGHNSYGAFDPSIKTQLVFQIINSQGLYDRPSALECLEQIRSITEADVSSILSNIPSSWMTKSEKVSYISWWSSEERIKRIDYIASRI